MSGKSKFRLRFGAALFGCLASAAVIPAPAAAQTYVGTARENPADSLDRNLKILATSPSDFSALIAAGKAALALGDEQAAAGFFGRAEAAWAASPLPQIGIGAALAHGGDANAALPYFARAVQLGATQAMLGLDRGLAYDLLGYHAQAQADYRAALVGPDSDEARRRLSLSLAITGNKDEALALLGPLMARGDAAAARCRAFVLALTGDTAGARTGIEAAMPGSSQQMAYFFHRLPSLASPQKAAAVHLGLFPDSTQLAAATPTYGAPAADRLSSIDQLLGRNTPPVGQPPAARQPSVQTASTVARRSTVSRPRVQPDADNDTPSRLWLQLASGDNASALPREFRRITSRHDRLFDGITGYVAETGGRARLLIGPFRNREEAQIFADDLATLDIDAFSWTNPPGQTVRKLSSE